MTSFWGFVVGFLASSALGALFCNVLLTVYEKRRGDMVNQGDPELRELQTQRLIFRWSIGVGTVIGVLTMILKFLAQN
jgi:hypothetical protein